VSLGLNILASTWAVVRCTCTQRRNDVCVYASDVQYLVCR